MLRMSSPSWSFFRPAAPPRFVGEPSAAPAPAPAPPAPAPVACPAASASLRCPLRMRSSMVSRTMYLWIVHWRV